MTIPLAGMRQTNLTCGVADVVAAVRKYTVYITNLNRNRRINNFVTQSQSKMSRASTVFVQAAAALADATLGGTKCNGATPNASVATVYTTLQNCSKTVASNCDVKLTSAESSIVDSCNKSLNAYVAAFQVIFFFMYADC